MAYNPSPPLGQATMANSEPVVIASDQSAVPVSDNGSSLTVDGTVTVTQSTAANLKVDLSGTASNTNAIKVDGSAATQPVSGQLAVTKAGLWTLDSNSGVDIGDVTINNAAGASAVNIQDGGNSITVDGTVELGATTLASTFDVSVTNASIPVTDNGGSLTVDGTVTASQPTSTAWRVQISDGTSDVPIDAAHADGETNTEAHIDIGAKTLVFNGTAWDRQRGDTTGTYVVGNIAHDTVDSGNPVKIGFQAEASSLPTAVASGDRVNGIADVFGRQLVGNIDASMQVWKSANYTTQQTGAAIWTPSGGKKVCVTYLSVASYATTTGRVIIWFGASGDTTYTAGTDQLAWAGSFAPSANAKPGAIIQLPFGITAATADHVLRITTDAGISLDITVYGYEC